MNLQLTNTQVNSISFNGGGYQRALPAEGSVNIQYKAVYDEKMEKLFGIQFFIDIPDKDSDESILKVVFTGYFTTEDVITPEFRRGNFPAINAPAIVFPYLRAFIASFLVGSGFTPIHLPTINFQTVGKDLMKEAGLLD